MKKIPRIKKSTFWDVEISEIDFRKNSEWLINRIFDRGTLNEVYEIINYYGSDFVKKTLQNTNENLSSHAILLARAVFKLKKSDFKCCRKKRLHRSY